MSKIEALRETVSNSYSVKGDYIVLGAAKYENQVLEGTQIKFPLSMMNRHGLIAGATGTGKTKTLQIVAELLSEKGVPSICMDIKGDLSGLAKPGAINDKILERSKAIGLEYTAQGSPVDIMTISNAKGVKVRATVTEFGPLLLSKILELSDAQETILTVVFKYADDNNIPLVDLDDLRAVLNHISGEGRDEIKSYYGSFSSQSVGAIIRKILMLEQQKADEFFDNPSFEVEDFLRTDSNGKGIIHIFQFMNMQDRPKLFSTFMLQILAEIFSVFPEAGDLDKPKLVIFIDEAHLIFKDANKALLDQLEATIKLIRSKGVGIFFCTQNPSDIPDEILGQLGFKLQHALRAFTPKDYEMIKKTAKNFRKSDYYDIEALLTNMGTGEALLSGLTEKGLISEAVYTYLRAPMSRMDVLTEEEIDEVVNSSRLAPIYNRTADRETAQEILLEKMNEARSEEEINKKKNQWDSFEEIEKTKKRPAKQEKSVLEKALSNPTIRSIGNTIAREGMRGLLSVLGVKSTNRKR